MPLTQRFAQALDTLSDAGQEHVLAHWDHLDEPSKATLLDQVESIDWPEVARLVHSHVLQRPEHKLPEHIEPVHYYPRNPDDATKGKYKEADEIGRDLIRLGKVAAFTVAGGQGTRLGFNGPKGSFPATPIRNATLFQVFAEQILKANRKYKTNVPWYVMTSTANHDDTAAFLSQHKHFGLDPADVHCFSQGMMPAIDPSTGKALLNAVDSIALSPNGHGGSLKALYTSGSIADMKERGVEHLSYFQVDNPNVKCIDPLFLGLHAMDESQMSSKMLEKAYPKEKLGNFCKVGGRVTVIEYSDLPDELAEARLPDGELKFRAGSIAIHALRVDFIESLNTAEGGFSLPFHRADKKVPYIDGDAQLHQPAEPNAVKLETFVFDALPLCEHAIILETDRVEEFAPIKNADTPAGEQDAVDSPATSKQLQSERAARWLAAKGVAVAQNDDGWADAVIELPPLVAVEPNDLDDLDLPDAIDAGTSTLLGN